MRLRSEQDEGGRGCKVFKTGPFNHSGTHPSRCNRLRRKAEAMFAVRFLGGQEASCNRSCNRPSKRREMLVLERLPE